MRTRMEFPPLDLVHRHLKFLLEAGRDRQSAIAEIMASYSYSRERTVISDLPREVLHRIFSYLPNDIGTVRLVCSKWCSEWNESCNYVCRKARCNIREMLSNEKIVVNGLKMRHVAEFFGSREFKRRIRNLHLKHIAFEASHISFLQNLRGELCSLKLEYCKADEFVPLLRVCETFTMTTLSLYDCSPTIVRSFCNADGSCSQTRIGSLTLKGCRLWSDVTMDDCFRVFSRLRSLTLKSLNLQSFGDSEERLFDTPNILSFESIYKALVMIADRLVELNLESIDGISPEQIEQIASIPRLRLQKLTLDCHVTTPASIHSIVTRQPDLRNITLRGDTEIQLDGSADWIERCSITYKKPSSVVRMAENNDIQETAKSEFPPKVLGRIFSYLPNNIRVIRLVCREWNKACNEEEVSGDEKLVLRNRRSNRVNEFFLNEKPLRNIYNLHLVDIAFEAYHVPFFEKFGGKLRSLTLSRCSADMYAPLLIFCTNLDTLIFDDCSPTIGQLFHRADGSFVETKVILLGINNCKGWSDETMDACFRLCPSLRSLTLNSLRVKSVGGGQKRFCTGSGFFSLSFHCLYRALSLQAASLVELNLKSIDEITPEQMEQIVSIPDLKLRTLKFDCHQNTTPENICNIFTRQPDLQNLTIRRSTGQIVLNGSADWFERCSKLTSLEIQAFDFRDDEYDLERKLLNALTSRLHHRELTRNSVIRRDFENNRGTFVHLRRFELSVPCVDYGRVLMEVPVNVDHLSLKGMHGISSKTLELISNRFTNLKTLEFTIGSVACDEHSSERIVSFGNLTKLKTLQITVLRVERCERCPPAVSFLKRIVAPGLQFLELWHFDAIDVTSFCDMVKNYPLLECFVLKYCTFAMDPSDLRVMSDWKKLNSFYFGDNEYLKLHRRRDNEVKFNSCIETCSFYVENSSSFGRT